MDEFLPKTIVLVVNEWDDKSRFVQYLLHYKSDCSFNGTLCAEYVNPDDTYSVYIPHNN